MEITFASLAELKTNLDKAVSQMGYFFVCDQKLAMRTSVTLSFCLKGKPSKLQIRSEVVFSGGGGIGVVFTESTEGVNNRYTQFLNELSGVKPTPAEAGPVVQPATLHQAEAKPAEVPVTPSPASQKAQAPVEEMMSDEDEIPPMEADAMLPEEPMPAGHKIQGTMRNVLKIEAAKGAMEKDKFADFGELSFTKILVNIFEGKSTGIVRFKTEEVEKVVYFRGGRPVFVESNPPLSEESIGHILLTKGKVKKEDLDRAVKYVEEHGVRIGEGLLAIKAVSATLLKDALTFQLKVKLYELFKWKEASFEMEMMQSLSQKFGTRPINIVNVIYRGLKEKLKELYPADLEKYISPIYDKFLTKKESKLFDLENLGFNPHERRFWDLMLNGKRRVREIFAGSTLNKPDTFRFLYALLELDLVSINDTATLDMPNIERDLSNQARFMEKMDYFEVLAAHWSLNREKIENLYKKKIEEFTEKKKIPNLSAEGKASIDRILAVLKKAYDELSNDSKRREYRKQILGDAESKVAADLAARQAQLMEFRNDMKEARSLIEVAMDLDPTNSEYRTLFSRYGGRK